MNKNINFFPYLYTFLGLLIISAIAIAVTSSGSQKMDFVASSSTRLDIYNVTLNGGTWNLISVLPWFVGKDLKTLATLGISNCVWVPEYPVGWLFIDRKWMTVDTGVGDLPSNFIDVTKFSISHVGFGLWLYPKEDCRLSLPLLNVKTLADGNSMTVDGLTLKVIQTFSSSTAKIEIRDGSGNVIATLITVGTTSISYQGSTYTIRILSSSSTALGVPGYAEIFFGKD